MAARLAFAVLLMIGGAAAEASFIDQAVSYAKEIPTAYAVIAVVSIVALGFFFKSSRSDEWRGGATGILANEHTSLKGDGVNKSYEEFEGFFGKESRDAAAKSHQQLLEKRQKGYTTMVNNFYDLVTDFYEYGWGECFHFGPRFHGEEFQESLRRAEYYLCSRLGMDQNKHAADIGCGVGGPMRNMARFSGARITGVNNNDYQIKVGTRYNAREGLQNRCDFLKSDFMKIPVQKGTFDCAYAIEATCHAPDKTACFAEVFRILKPGGTFAGYDWVMTDKYDSKNERHRMVKQGIEVGNSLPELPQPQGIVDALKGAGFEVLDHFDAERGVHSKFEVPWYITLTGQYTLKGFRMTWIGRNCTQILVTVLEALRIAPKGTTKVSSLLNATAIDLVEGGRREIFTPSYFFLARKPGY